MPQVRRHQVLSDRETRSLRVRGLPVSGLRHRRHGAARDPHFAAPLVSGDLLRDDRQARHLVRGARQAARDLPEASLDDAAQAPQGHGRKETVCTGWTGSWNWTRASSALPRREDARGRERGRRRSWPASRSRPTASRSTFACRSCRASTGRTWSRRSKHGGFGRQGQDQRPAQLSFARRQGLPARTDPRRGDGHAGGTALASDGRFERQGTDRRHLSRARPRTASISRPIWTSMPTATTAVTGRTRSSTVASPR